MEITMMKKVYFNHDGGVDDLISLFLLLQMDNVKLTGVSVIPADCYLEPAISASRKIIDRFSKENIEVAASNSRAKNPFPKDWRMHAFYVDALPILNESGKDVTPIAAKPAHHHLIETLLQTEEKTTLLFTGPLTDLARALYEAPVIKGEIERLVWMGGTFRTAGNVHEPEHDGTAEWNSFWDPEAVARVWESKIKIDLVTLESTNQVPLTIDIREQWAKERKYIGMDFLGQCYAMVPPLVHFSTNSTYYLWDVLTTALVGNTSLAKSQAINSIVHTYGPSQGRTEETADGRPVNVVYDVNHNEFFDYITGLAKKVSN
ncbi:nucleoside hydrolase [Bacillus wiedmannii]|uniref:nucleoside hydrolase n=1 Tax=Bacillus wiedmannii TaxID=1890302 RepID=UPI000BF49B7F|nr:nucleoside hydrolase [Bacillus wiedmannii]PFZ22628.1 ABC transporter substrate-binding protein [Bacillus wiedmannii]PGC55496.1 ABC transporter substrate-binding protein [Bacillus wiedmannii]